MPSPQAEEDPLNAFEPMMDELFLFMVDIMNGIV